MKGFYILLFYICLASTSLLATNIFCYYLKIPIAIKLINPNLGGYEFILWLMFIPNLFATFYTFKEIINKKHN
jgi:hypothetical protein